MLTVFSIPPARRTLSHIDTHIPPPPQVPAVLNQLASFPENMDDFIATYIQVHLEHERKRLASIPHSSPSPSSSSSSAATNDRAQTWISTIENAPRSIEAIQTLMDTKEVEMNETADVSELQRLDREWSALEWLQGIIRQVGKEHQQQLLQSKKKEM